MSDAPNQKEDEITDADLEKIIQEVSEDEKAEAVAVQSRDEKKNSANIVELKEVKNNAPAKDANSQSLSLELSGTINLKLTFASGERSIEVECTEEAFFCRMADGTEFKIPTGFHKKSKAA